MVDIPEMVKKKRREQNAEYLLQFQMTLASNNRGMKEEAYENFVRNLTKNLESREDKQSNKLDRHAFEALRFMTNQGANKTGGR